MQRRHIDVVTVRLEQRPDPPFGLEDRIGLQRRRIEPLIGGAALVELGGKRLQIAIIIRWRDVEATAQRQERPRREACGRRGEEAA